MFLLKSWGKGTAAVVGLGQALTNSAESYFCIRNTTDKFFEKEKKNFSYCFLKIEFVGNCVYFGLHLLR